MNKLEILVVEDEPQIRKLLQIILENNDYRVTFATTGKEALLLCANNFPELVLLDIGLPDISGHQVLKDLRQWYNKAIIVLSVFDNESDIVSALDNGATDYLIKPFRTAELLARIRAAIRRNHSEKESCITKIKDLEVDFLSMTVKKNGEYLKLTSTEFNLLAIFVRNSGRVLTHQFLLQEIWGSTLNTETQYLRVFVGTLRKKIEDDHNKPQYIITENGVGYRFASLDN